MSRFYIYIFCLFFSFPSFSNSLEEINKNLSEFDKISSLTQIDYSSFSSIDYDFSGVVKLSNCSASVVKLKNTNYKKALLLTNGHCMRGFQRPGEVVFNKKFKTRVAILDKKAKTIAIVNTTKILYATMTRTDMALLELDHTYEKLKDKYNVEPLIISDQTPLIGDEIEIISGYWRRGFSCAIENIVYNLKEADWDWFDSIGYTKACKVYGGTSGSPVVSVASREVIAVNNTGNEGGRCTLNSPCEIDEDGEITTQKDKGYAQNTFWLYNCLNPVSESEVVFDFSRSDCKLLAPSL